MKFASISLGQTVRMVCLAACSLSLALPIAAVAASDVLDRPATASALATQRPITALARAGSRIVAAGQRGHVLYSDDEGLHWTQASVPVSSDLTALFFTDAKTGYAVGHDGVVLGTSDGGVHWSKLFDGRAANALLLQYMQGKVDAGGGDAASKLLVEAKRNVELGPDKPFLDVWFADAQNGFIIGAYNLIFRTSDGGKSWEPWFDRTDNPKLLNLYSIRPGVAAKGARAPIYIAGESGLLLVLDAEGTRFRELTSDYKGSFFGIVASRVDANDAANAMLAFGMRGHALSTHDGGAHWQPLDTGLAASITAADVAADGRIALVDQGGGLAVSRDGGLSFARVAVARPMPFAAVLASPGGFVLGGARGLIRIDAASTSKTH